jgi:phage protein D
MVGVVWNAGQPAVKMEFKRVPVPGYFAVKFPTVQLPRGRVDYISLTVRQKIREHDTALLRIRSRNVNWFKYFQSGTPVQFTYWAGPQNRSKARFIGYVTHVRLVTVQNENDETVYERELVCVAASREFRKTAQKTYKNKTPSDIALEIAEQFRFNLIPYPDGLRRDTITQSGQTYWQFLHKLADKVGYVLKAEGTNLVFMPLTTYAAAYLDSAPLLSDYRTATPSVLRIDSWSGDTSVDKDRLSDEAVFVSVNPVTDEVTFESAKPSANDRTSRSKFQRFMSSGVVSHTAYDAKRLALGAADNGLLSIDASMTVVGNVALSPYRPVMLDLRDPNLTGTWLVKEVTHRIYASVNPEYECDLVVGTDSVDGISRRRLVRRPAVTRNVQGQLLGTSGVDSRLVTASTGFVTGAAGSSSGTWVTR